VVMHERQGEAAIDMERNLLRRWLVMLQHVLDEVDSSARTVEFVAEQHISGTGRGAKSAMHAFPKNRVGFRDVGVGETFGREMGLHVSLSRR
jgi:hypothetical protein